MLCLPFFLIGQPVDWSADRPLAWADFRAETPMGTRNAAATSCGIRYDHSRTNIWTGQPVVEITAFMDPEGSWVDPEQAGPDLLRHEQGHFDLAEVFARRARRDLDVRKLTRRRAESIYRDRLGELASAQWAYDRDTNHGTLSSAQAEWSARIRGWLSAESPDQP